MREEVEATCTSGFAHGKLAGSIIMRRDGKWEWRIGSPLDYASYVNDGRGPVFPRRKRSLYLKGLDFWMPPGKPVGAALAKHFVENTISKLP